MISIKKFKALAMSFPETEEQPHFEKTSFRVKKKIFATLDEKQQKATLKFSPIDQSVFCVADKMAISPVPNKWGKQGWTVIDLTKVGNAILKDALTTSYETIAGSLIKKVQ